MIGDFSDDRLTLVAGALPKPRQQAVAAARHWWLPRRPRECDRRGARLPDRPLPAERTALRLLLPQARLLIARLPKLASQLASTRDGPHRLLPFGAAEPRARSGHPQCSSSFGELIVTFGRTFGCTLVVFLVVQALVVFLVVHFGRIFGRIFHRLLSVSFNIWANRMILDSAYNENQMRVTVLYRAKSTLVLYGNNQKKVLLLYPALTVS